jgi:enoyl-CoA hydratase/carnithine racemase
VADLEYAVADRVATIRLNRPERKNAFTMEMVDAWAEALDEVHHDPAVRVLVLTGTGDTFCSGVDLERRLDGTVATPLSRKQILSERVHRIPLLMESLDKPVIAAINGPAVAAGLDMALMCDIRIMARSARLSEGYIKIGLVPGDGGCYYLPRLVGTARALELLLTGDFIGAEEAARIGLVNRVVDDADLEQEVQALARRIADNPPVAVALTKRAVYQSMRTDLRTSLDLISSHTAVVGFMNDTAEAMAARREGRTPAYDGT